MNKNYHFTNLVMLQLAYEMLMNLKANLPDFEKLYAGFDDAFMQDLANQIDAGFKALGVDAKIEVKSDKQYILNLIDSLNNMLSSFLSAAKTALRDNPDRFTSIADSLQLLKYSRPYGRKELMDIALNVSQSLGAYKTELVTAKVIASQIDDLVTTATDYTNAFKNLSTNVNKLQDLTADQQVMFNKIYSEIKAISEMGQQIYRRDRNKLRLFAISVISNKYTPSRPRKAKDQTTTTTDTTTPPPTTPTTPDEIKAA